MSISSQIAFSNHAASTREEWRRQIARLPITMRPALNQQVNTWDNLFPFEQKRAADFLEALASFEPLELDNIVYPLRELERKMDVARWNFSTASGTMTNASQLARSPYYADWRREIQRVFTSIEARERASTEPAPALGRLIVLVLPDTLPICSIAGHKSWDERGLEYQIGGDIHRITELALDRDSGLPAILIASAKPESASADCWLIDADAHLGGFLPSTEQKSISVLEYAVLKSFKDQFLAQVNTVPKDIEGTDQILDHMRHRDWSTSWPSSLADQKRLRSFVIELFLSGNGALIFSNAFVQWAASEAIRRARPRLVMARFGLRSKPKPFTGIAIFENQQKISALPDVDDPGGSAIDTLILARYIWLSSLRYPEAQHTSCICIAEASRSVYIIAPGEKRPSWPGDTAVTPEQIHAWMRSSLA